VLLAATAVLLCYFPNPLLGASVVIMILLLVLFLVCPLYATVLSLVIRSSLDITKQVFSVYAPGDLQITGANAFSFILIIGGTIYILAHRVPFLKAPLAKLLLLFLAISLIHFLIVDDLALSLMEFMRFLSAFIVYILVWDSARNSGNIRVIVNAILISAVIPVGAGIYQVVMDRGQFITGFIRAYGTFVHPNPFAFYLVIILALAVNFLFLKQRPLSRSALFGLIILGGVCLLFSFPRTAWFGFLMVIFLAAFFQDKRLFWLLIVLVLVFSILTPLRSRFYDLSTSFNSISHRLYIWRGGLDHLPSVPLLGRGLGSFVLLDVHQEPAHNDYLRVFLELGVLGLLGYLALSVALLVKLYAAIRRPGSPYGYSLACATFSVAVIFLTSSVLSNILFRPVLQWYFWALMAVTLKASEVEGFPAGEIAGWNVTPSDQNNKSD